jgi:hypothetical protein
MWLMSVSDCLVRVFSRELQKYLSFVHGMYSISVRMPCGWVKVIFSFFVYCEDFRKCLVSHWKRHQFRNESYNQKVFLERFPMTGRVIGFWQLIIFWDNLSHCDWSTLCDGLAELGLVQVLRYHESLQISILKREHFPRSCICPWKSWRGFWTLSIYCIEELNKGVKICLYRNPKTLPTLCLLFEIIFLT